MEVEVIGEERGISIVFIKTSYTWSRHLDDDESTSHRKNAVCWNERFIMWDKR